jgi:hypothetical protein
VSPQRFSHQPRLSSRLAAAFYQRFSWNCPQRSSGLSITRRLNDLSALKTSLYVILHFPFRPRLVIKPETPQKKRVRKCVGFCCRRRVGFLQCHAVQPRSFCHLGRCESTPCKSLTSLLYVFLSFCCMIGLLSPVDVRPPATVRPV